MNRSYYNNVYNTPATSPEETSSMQGEVGSECKGDYGENPLYMAKEDSYFIQSSKRKNTEVSMEGGDYRCNMSDKRMKGNSEPRGNNAMWDAKSASLNTKTKYDADHDGNSEIIYKSSIGENEDRLKYVVAKSFRDKIYIDIREYFEKNKEEIPTKKGINLTLAEFTAFCLVSKDIKDAIHGYRMRG